MVRVGGSEGRVVGVRGEAMGEKPEDEGRCWDDAKVVLEVEREACARERG